ncbi:MAG: Ig-like domain-containing protein [Elusimicrobia bacterium]|nr:Ig-like domain-containing protein [Elusimicrobiota bacterium]
MTLNGSAGGDDEAKAVALDGGGNVYVVGRSSATGLGPVLWLGKFNLALNLISSATYNIPTTSAGNGTPKAGLVVAPGGNIFAVDWVLSGGVYKILLAQFSPALALVSSTTFFNGYNANIGFGLDCDSSGNLYAVGSVPPAPATSNDIWVGKFNSSLAFIASATVAGAGGNTDQSYSAKVDPTDSFLFISGNKNNTGLIGDLWVAKYSLGLNLLAQASFRGTGTGGSIAFDDVVSDTRIYVSGTWNTASGDKIFVGELDYSLNMISSAAIDTGGTGINYAYGLTVDTMSPPNVYLAGFVTPAGPMQAWLGKFGLAAPTLTSISLIPSTSTFIPGQSVQFTASGTFSDSSSRALGPSDGLTWSVATSSVATTTSNGLATAWASGAALLTVSSGAVNASAPLVVTPALPAGGSHDEAVDIVRRGASLYAVGASSQGSRGLDLWVAKLNASDMSVAASRLMNGSADGDDEAVAVALDASGNVYTVGRSSAAGLGPVLWLGKFDSALNFISSVTYPIPTPAAGAGTPTAGLVVAPGGNLYAVDYIPVGGVFKILIAQFTPALAFVSSATFFNGYSANIGFRLDVDASGNLYAVGSVPPAPATSNDTWIGKFNSSLAFITSTTIAGAGGNSDQAYSVKVDPSGSYLFAVGNKNNTGLIGDLWVGKYDLSLHLLAQGNFRGTGTGGSIAFDNVVSDTRVYVSGTWNVAAADGKIFVAELD